MRMGKEFGGRDTAVINDEGGGYERNIEHVLSTIQREKMKSKKRFNIIVAKEGVTAKKEWKNEKIGTGGGGRK